MKTLKITPPEGFEIDKDKSTFEEIVFKSVKKQLPKTWVDLEKIDGYYIDNDSSISECFTMPINRNRNIFVTKEQAQAAIALAQLSQLREVYRSGWVPDWRDSDQEKYVVIMSEGEINANVLQRFNSFLSFESEEIRDEFLKNFRNLIDEASPLLFG
jgi:hypothetical protein